MQLKITIAGAFLILLSTLPTLSQSMDVPAGIALSPARFELEMKPGTETTVVVNLDYRAPSEVTQPVRILASLNDWTITPEGQVQYFAANTQKNSAAPWMIY